MAFLDGYTDVPQNSGSSGGKYMKLTQGANQFRIVGSLRTAPTSRVCLDGARMRKVSANLSVGR